LSGQQTHLTQELTSPVGGDHALVGLAGVLDDVDGAFQQDDHVVSLVAVGEKDLAVSDAVFRAITT
jgi:hypothetical protein